MHISNLNFLLESTFYTENEKVNIDINYKSKEGTMKFKTISLESFVNFIKKFSTNDTIINDTGFLTNNLIRKVETVAGIHYFFFYEKITSSFLTNYVKEIFNFYGKNKVPYITKKISINYEDVLFHVVYNKNSNSVQYTIYFVEPTYDLIGFKKSINSETVLYKNFLPNAFIDTICWGANLDRTQITTAAQTGDITFLKSLPSMYFNSKFNNDLFFRAYGSVFNIFSYGDSEIFITALKEVLSNYYDSQEVVNKVEILKNSINYVQFNILLPLLMNEPSLKVIFFSYLKESVPPNSFEKPVLNLETLCSVYGIQYV